jgi:hypothetical protein
MVIRVLLLLLALILASCLGIRLPSGVVPPDGSAPTPAPDDGDSGATGTRSYMVIESVEGLVLQTYPAQIVLQVSGYQPDGCEFPVVVDQRREGKKVFVEISRVLPPETVCPMVIVPYQASIRLDGGFESGSYTLHVNEYVLKVDL